MTPLSEDQKRYAEQHAAEYAIIAKRLIELYRKHDGGNLSTGRRLAEESDFENTRFLLLALSIAAVVTQRPSLQAGQTTRETVEQFADELKQPEVLWSERGRAVGRARRLLVRLIGRECQRRHRRQTHARTLRN